MSALRPARAGLVAALLVLPVDAAPAATVRVASIGEIEASLANARSATRIELAPVTFHLDRPLVVPDGVLMHGGGRMAVAADGRAAGLVEGSAATLVVTGDWQGDAVSLGDGSELRGLRIVDHGAGDRPPGPGRRNVIGVGSRRAGDRVLATIRDCEIETDQAFNVGRHGPLGRAIVVSTRNLQDAGGPHAQARAGLRLERSIVRARESNTLFAINFAAGGRVDVRIEDSVLEGVLSAAGGTARPDAVSGARTELHSRNSRYVRAGRYDRFGWQMIGGSGTPHVGLGSDAGTERNELVVDSRGDAIEGFSVAVHAAGGRRVGALSGPSSGNVARLRLRDLTIRGAGEAAVDFELSGALAEPSPGGEEVPPPGDSNLLSVDLRGFREGAGASRYDTVQGPAGTRGNRIEFAGDRDQFVRSNPAFQPVPGAEFFPR